MQLNPYDRSVYIPTAGLVVVGDNTNIQVSAQDTITGEGLKTLIRRANAPLREYSNITAGVHLERTEATQIVEWVNNAEPGEQLAMLLDQPGTGKTVVMRDVLERLEAQDLPVLAIKADLLSGISSQQDLADRLGLPPTLEECVHKLVRDQPFVIILDQLDALSLSLSRDQATLDVMLSVIARLRETPGVRIIASCRTFDLHNDPRLASIKVDKEFRLQPLDDEQVAVVLRALGINASDLLPAHRTLLRVPLHLDIYARVTQGTGGHPTERFGSLQDLYQALWQRTVEGAPVGGVSLQERVSDAVYRLVDAMQASRQTSAPEGVLDDYPGSTRHLQREGFIRREGTRLLFLHQTLFDYCYARRFVVQGRSIAGEVLNGPQGLFERSQMIQVLAYLRGADSAAYRQELTSLLFDQRLRVHLRLLLIGWVGALLDPTADEVRLARRLIRNPSNRGEFLHAIRGNPAWFDALKVRTIPDLLRSTDDQVVEVAVHYLSTVINARPADVVQLHQPYLARNETWDARIAYCLSRLDNWGSGEAVDILCDLIRRGQSMERAALSFYDLARTNPDAGCRVLRVYLDRKMNDLTGQRQHATQETWLDSHAPMVVNLRDSTVNEHQLLGDHGIAEILDQAVKMCPDSVIENLLPWFVRATALFTRDQAGESYPTDSIFCWGWYERHLSEGALFAVRMSEAIQKLARSDPSTFRALVAGLASIELYAVQRVLVQGYLADPATFAYDIFAYLVGDIRRLHIGEVGNSRYDSCRLYGAAFQFVDFEHRAELEQLVLDIRPDWEKRTLRFQGHTQLHFLKSVPRDMLSLKARRTRDELERKFPELEMKPPVGVDFQTVEAPIDEVARARMSDKDWIGAMRRYNDSTSRSAIWDGTSRGGVEELSRALADHVKQDPARYYRLAQQFDDSISAYYWMATISSLADAKTPAEWIFDLVRRVAPRPGEHRRGVCWAVAKRSADGVPDDILDVMTAWAVHDPHPEREVWLELADSGPPPYHQGDPYAYGINTNRGVAVITVVQCALDRKPSQTERAFSLLQQAAHDPSTAVRSCVIRCLGQMLSLDAQRTLTIFENALSGHLALLQTKGTHEFLYWTYYEQFPRTRPFIDAMLDSEHEETRQAGARLACLASLRYQDAAAMESRVMTGDSVMRRGAAQVYAANLHKENVRQVCQERLLILMHDEDEQVLSQVGECFRHMQPDAVEVLRPLIEAFLDAPAMMVMCRPLVAYLAQVAFEEPDYVLRAAERIWETAGSQVVDIRTSWAILERDLTRLPLAVYTHTLDPSLKSRSMDLFEHMLLSGSREANRALEDWDRR